MSTKHDDQLLTLIDGEPTPDALNLLRDDPAARRRYLDLVALQIMLHEKLEGDMRVQGSEVRVQQRKFAIRNPQSAIIFALAAAIAMAITAWFLYSPGPLNPEPSTTAPSPVAMLSDLTPDAVFAASAASGDQSDRPLTLGADLTSGPIHLTAGKVQLMFRSGAVVDLTGPCEFEMTGPNQGRLTLGQLRASVPDSAHGFSISAPRGVEVVDLGTEFTMRVLPGGESFVLVHQGLVRLSLGQQQRLLGVGDSLMAGSNGTLRQPLAEEFPELLPIGRLNPVAWWRLGQTHEGAVANAMSPNNTAQVWGGGTVVQDAGRMALRLERGAYVRVFESGASPIREAFTFVAWIKWEGGGPWQRVFDFGHDTKRNMFFTPNAGDTGRPRFAVTTRGHAGEHRADCSAPMPRDRWVMLAVTFTDSAAAVYLDGEPIARNDAVPSAPGELLGPSSFLGASQYREDPTFHGLIADAAVFDRALTETEIRNLHQQTQASPEEASER